jgi:hypothetical protein
MLTRSAPMKRGGFKRPAYVAAPAAPAQPIPRELAERIRTGPARLTMAPKPAEPVRHERYRRLVASLPCIYCGIEGHSQCAHANQGKGMSTKADDRMSFPLCACRPGVSGCHAQLDQGALFSKAVRRETEDEWARRTRMQIDAAGLWPSDLARWSDDDEHHAPIP